jgi:hypothetical protein
LAPFIAGRTVIRDDLGQAYSAGTLRPQALSAIEGVGLRDVSTFPKGDHRVAFLPSLVGLFLNLTFRFLAHLASAEIDRSLFFGLFFSPPRAWSSGPISTTTFVGLRVSGHDQWDFLWISAFGNAPVVNSRAIDLRNTHCTRRR